MKQRRTARLCRTATEPLALKAMSSTSSASSSKLSPLLRPGGMRRNPLSFAGSESISFSGNKTSSKPPGQNGTFPDFPRTKLCNGPGARSRDVEVKADVGCEMGTLEIPSTHGEVPNSTWMVTYFCASCYAPTQTRTRESKCR